MCGEDLDLGFKQQANMEMPESEVGCFLNCSKDSRTREEDKSNSTVKSNVSELLAITDNAVKSLTGYKSDPSHTRTPYGELHLLSNTDLLNHLQVKDDHAMVPGERPPHQVTVQRHTYAPDKQNEDSSFHSNESKSTTASEVLKRATKGDDDNYKRLSLDSHNTSISSIKSASSRASTTNSSFVSGGAKRVKISAKKLREIKSPFDDHHSVHSRTKHSNTTEGISDPRQSLPHVPHTTDQVIEGDGIHITSIKDHAISVQKHIGNGSVDVSMTEVKQRPPVEGSPSDDGSVQNSGAEKMQTVTRATADSGYITEKLQQRTMESANTTHEDVASIQEEVVSQTDNAANASNNSGIADNFSVEFHVSILLTGTM